MPVNIDDFVSTMTISPARSMAKMSARRPSGSGISSSTEQPAWRISRQAPRHTATVISGRVWRGGEIVVMRAPVRVG